MCEHAGTWVQKHAETLTDDEMLLQGCRAGLFLPEGALPRDPVLWLRCTTQTWLPEMLPNRQQQRKVVEAPSQQAVLQHDTQSPGACRAGKRNQKLLKTQSISRNRHLAQCDRSICLCLILSWKPLLISALVLYNDKLLDSAFLSAESLRSCSTMGVCCCKALKKALKEVRSTSAPEKWCVWHF